MLVAAIINLTWLGFYFFRPQLYDHDVFFSLIAVAWILIFFFELKFRTNVIGFKNSLTNVFLGINRAAIFSLIAIYLSRLPQWYFLLSKYGFGLIREIVFGSEEVGERLFGPLLYFFVVLLKDIVLVTFLAVGSQRRNRVLLLIYLIFDTVFWLGRMYLLQFLFVYLIRTRITRSVVKILVPMIFLVLSVSLIRFGDSSSALPGMNYFGASQYFLAEALQDFTGPYSGGRYLLGNVEFGIGSIFASLGDDKFKSISGYWGGEHRKFIAVGPEALLMNAFSTNYFVFYSDFGVLGGLLPLVFYMFKFLVIGEMRSVYVSYLSLIFVFGLFVPLVTGNFIVICFLIYLFSLRIVWNRRQVNPRLQS